MTLRPLHDRVLVRRSVAPNATIGGILIPDTAKEKPGEGEVIAVGAGARDNTGRRLPLSLKAGDHVLFVKAAGTELRLNAEDLLILTEGEVLGVFEDERSLRSGLLGRPYLIAAVLAVLAVAGGIAANLLGLL